jgi:excisionase family DNA binding protein
MMGEAVDESGDQILTVGEVASYLRLSEATIYRMAKAGRIPGRRVGRSWRFSSQQIREWFRGQETGPDGREP